ncbi:MAG: hypothetical protein FJ272_01905 [Planctomycetes bacterium]|nr:hypothetical protein [Planctomycetota bacterium]
MDGTSADMWGAAGGAKTNLPRGAWLKESRFAMFIHWGLYSELGGKWNDKTYYGIAEWIMNRGKIPVAEYERVAGRFNPTGFDAREWVRLAKAAGMRHIMITAKHHDGFAMFKSAVSPFNIVNVRWMEKFGDWKHAECLAGWRGAESTATWQFHTVEPSSFYLDVEYTCPAEDDYSEWQVTLDGQRLTFPLIDTGERPKRAAFGGALPRFRTYRIGVVDFANPGPHQLHLGPASPEGKGIRISSLILMPAK